MTNLDMIKEREAAKITDKSAYDYAVSYALAENCYDCPLMRMCEVVCYNVIKGMDTQENFNTCVNNLEQYLESKA